MQSQKNYLIGSNSKRSPKESSKRSITEQNSTQKELKSSVHARENQARKKELLKGNEQSRDDENAILRESQNINPHQLKGHSIQVSVVQTNFMEYLKYIALLGEEKEHDLKRTIVNVNLRNSQLGENLSEDQVLSAALKEYFISLDDQSLSKMCESFVDRWKNKIDRRYSQKDQEKVDSGNTSYHMKSQKQSSHFQQVEPSEQEQIITLDNLKSSPELNTVPRFLAPTISQMQKQKVNEDFEVDQKKGTLDGFKNRRARRQERVNVEQEVQEVKGSQQRVESGVTEERSAKDAINYFSGQSKRTESSKVLTTAQLKNLERRDSKEQQLAGYRSGKASDRDDLSAFKGSSSTGLNIFERLHDEGNKKLESKCTLEELKVLKDLKDCTFQPSISQAKNNLSEDKSRDEFFSQLVKSGMKTAKLEELERIKAEYELKDCTFKPTLKAKNRDKSTGYKQEEKFEEEEENAQDQTINEVWQRLHDERIEKRNLAKLEQEKVLMELRECTFSPHINKQKSARQSSRSRDRKAEEQEDPYTRLYNKHIEQEMARIKKLEEKEEEQMKVCSFMPERLTRGTDKKYLSRKSVDHEKAENMVTQSSGAVKEDDEYYEKLYKKKQEYEAKRKERIERVMNENTFQPKTNKNKHYVVTKDVIERNQDFINKKNEKRQKRIDDEKEQLTFSPTLQASKSMKKMKSIVRKKVEEEEPKEPIPRKRSSFSRQGQIQGNSQTEIVAFKKQKAGQGKQNSGAQYSPVLKQMPK